MKFDGLLLVDKPQGVTSHDVIARLRKILDRKDIGHTGTLDPMATGLMVTLLGEATKLSSYILGQNKTYELEVILGKKTDSGDRTGKVVEEQPVPDLTQQDFLRAGAELEGVFEWPVPLFSAVKVDGEKLYEKAHRGESVESTPVKTMQFLHVKLLSAEQERARYQVECSKGSYIRTWAEKLSEKLGTVGTLGELRRLRSEPYSVEDALTFEELEAGGEKGFVPLSRALPDATALTVSGMDQKLILNGQISKDLKSRLISSVRAPIEAKVFKILDRSPSPRLLALIGLDPGRGFEIRRVFKANLD